MWKECRRRPKPKDRNVNGDIEWQSKPEDVYLPQPAQLQLPEEQVQEADEPEQPQSPFILRGVVGGSVSWVLDDGLQKQVWSVLCWCACGCQKIRGLRKGKI